MSTITAGIRLDDQAAKLVGRRGIHHAVIVVESGDGSRSRIGATGEADADGTPMRGDTPYHYASVTKLHTAATTMRLVERGVLELDAPVTEYLPSTLTEGLHRTDGVDRTGSISVRNLLAHTSGLPDYFLDTPEGERSFTEMLIEGDFSYSLEDVIDRVRHLTPYFPPQDPSAARQRARYSDTNFQLLGAIIAAVAGQPFEQVVEEQVIDPLGLDDTWFPARPRGVDRPSPASMWAGETLLARPRAMASMAPEGGLVGTAADAIRFLRALLSGSAFDRPDTIDQMLARWNRFGLPRDRSAIMAPGWPIEYGLGIKRFRVPRLLRAGMRSPLLIGHTGANGAWAFYSPERDLYLAGTVGQTTAAGVPYRFVPKLVRALGTG